MLRKVGRRACAVTVVALAGSALWAEPALASGRVSVIVMENKAYSKIVGSSKAPYTNSLIAQGHLFTNYAAVQSGSLHDYLAMTSGLTSTVSPTSPNVFQAMDSAGVKWRSLQESMSANCGVGSSATVPGTSTKLYSRAHDPAFKLRGNESCSQNDIPMTSSTFAPATLPAFTYIVPNQCDDMHTLPASGQACPAFFGSNGASTSIAMGDGWLSTVVPQLLAQADMTVILLWDEGRNTSGQRVVALEAGAGISAGTTDGAAYNHYSLLAGLYSRFGLGTAPNNAASATPLPIP